MSESTLLILTALAVQPLHGYGIARSVAELSGGQVQLRPGTLYGALDRLDQQGLIVVDREEPVGDRLRRFYRLSADGAAVLAERERRSAAAAPAVLRPRLSGGTA